MKNLGVVVQQAMSLSILLFILNEWIRRSDAMFVFAILRAIYEAPALITETEWSSTIYRNWMIKSVSDAINGSQALITDTEWARVYLILSAAMRKEL